MNKFTKNVTAIALSAMVAGPAAAAEIVDAVWVGDKAKVEFTGNNCDNDKVKNLNMTMWMDTQPFGLVGVDINGVLTDFDSGPNTGLYEGEIFSWRGEPGDFIYPGIFVINKQGKNVPDAPKKAALGISEAGFIFLDAALDLYAAANCKNFAFWDFDLSQVTKNAAEWSKDGEKLTVKMDMKGGYENTDGKERDVKVKIRSGKMDVVI